MMDRLFVQGFGLGTVVLLLVVWYLRTSSQSLQPNGSRKSKRRSVHKTASEVKDSDEDAHFSEDSLASVNSPQSSRPGSGSRKRKRPTPKLPAEIHGKRKLSGQQLREPSSEECITSENEDSIYSDDSLTVSQQNSRRGTLPELSSRVVELHSERRQSAEYFASACISGGLSVDSREVHSRNRSEEGKVVGQSGEIPLGEESSMFRPHSGRVHPMKTETVDSSLVNVPTKKGKVRKALNSKADIQDGGNADDGGRDQDSMAQSPITLWGRDGSDFASEADIRTGLVGEQHKSGTSTQTPGSLAFSSSQIKNLSIKPTEIWTNASSLPNDESQLTAKERNVTSEDNMERKNSSKGPFRKESVQQQKLTELHSKYGLLSDDDNDDENQMQNEKSYPSGSLKESPNMTRVAKDNKGNIKFEVTISQDETNISYNVAKTEYNAYSLKDEENCTNPEAAIQKMPDTIQINLSEARETSSAERYESLVKERVIMKGSKESDDSGFIRTQRVYKEAITMSFEKHIFGDEIKRESSRDSRSTSEEWSSQIEAAQSNIFPDAHDKKHTQSLDTAETAEITSKSITISGKPSNKTRGVTIESNKASLQQVEKSMLEQEHSAIDNIDGGKSENAESRKHCLSSSMSGYNPDASTDSFNASWSSLNAATPSIVTSSGHYSFLSDDQDTFLTTESGEDIYLSPDQTQLNLESNSSFRTTEDRSPDSTEYKTPDESPRQEVMSSEYVSKTPLPLTAINKEIRAGHLFSKPTDNEQEKYFPINDDAVRQVLKKEVKKTIARLQRRVRSLSDSAISSDYTESESTTVSPRGSYLKGSPARYILPHDLTTLISRHAAQIATSPLQGTPILSPMSPKFQDTKVNQLDLTGKELRTNDSLLHPDEAASITGPKEEPLMEVSLQERRASHFDMPLNISREELEALINAARVETTQSGLHLPLPSPQGRFPEKLVDAILAIRRYPLLLQSSHKAHLRKRILGRMTKSLDDLTDLEKAYHAKDLEDNIAQRAAFILESKLKSNSSNIRSEQKMDNELFSSNNLHLSTPEGALKSKLQDQLEEMDMYSKDLHDLKPLYRSVLKNVNLQEQEFKDNSFVSDIEADIETDNLSEEQIRKLQIARAFLNSQHSLDELDRLSHQVSEMDAKFINISKKRQLQAKSASHYDVLRKHEPHNIDLQHIDTIKNYEHAGFNKANQQVDQSDDSICYVFVDKSLESHQISDTYALQSPRKSTYSRQNLSGISDMHPLSHSKSADSLHTSSDMDSGVPYRYCGYREPLPPLFDRAASLDDIYHQKIQKLHQDRPALHRSQSEDIVNAGNDSKMDSNEQIFPPSICVADMDADEESNACESVSDVSEPEFSNLRHASIISTSSQISTVGPQYRKASYPRHFQGFEQEAFLQLVNMTQANQTSSTSSDHLYSHARDSESSEYSSDSYFRSEVESGTPYFKEFKTGLPPMQAENGSQTVPNLYQDAETTAQFQMGVESPYQTFQATEGAENWHHVSDMMKETSGLLKNIQNQLPWLPIGDLDESEDSHDASTINGQPMSSRGLSPRKRTTKGGESIATQTDEVAILSGNVSQNEQPQQADAAADAMAESESKSIYLPPELQKKILEEYLQVQRERKSIDEQQMAGADVQEMLYPLSQDSHRLQMHSATLKQPSTGELYQVLEGKSIVIQAGMSEIAAGAESNIQPLETFPDPQVNAGALTTVNQDSMTMVNMQNNEDKYGQPEASTQASIAKRENSNLKVIKIRDGETQTIVKQDWSDVNLDLTINTDMKDDSMASSTQSTQTREATMVSHAVQAYVEDSKDIIVSSTPRFGEDTKTDDEDSKREFVPFDKSEKYNIEKISHSTSKGKGDLESKAHNLSEEKQNSNSKEKCTITESYSLPHMTLLHAGNEMNPVQTQDSCDKHDTYDTHDITDSKAVSHYPDTHAHKTESYYLDSISRGQKTQNETLVTSTDKSKTKASKKETQMHHDKSKAGVDSSADHEDVSESELTQIYEYNFHRYKNDGGKESSKKGDSQRHAPSVKQGDLSVKHGEKSIAEDSINDPIVPKMETEKEVNVVRLIVVGENASKPPQKEQINQLIKSEHELGTSDGHKQPYQRSIIQGHSSDTTDIDMESSRISSPSDMQSYLTENESRIFDRSSQRSTHDVTNTFHSDEEMSTFEVFQLPVQSSVAGSDASLDIPPSTPPFTEKDHLASVNTQVTKEELAMTIISAGSTQDNQNSDTYIPSINMTDVSGQYFHETIRDDIEFDEELAQGQLEAVSTRNTELHLTKPDGTKLVDPYNDEKGSRSEEESFAVEVFGFPNKPVKNYDRDNFEERTSEMNSEKEEEETFDTYEIPVESTLPGQTTNNMENDISVQIAHRIDSAPYIETQSQSVKMQSRSDGKARIPERLQTLMAPSQNIATSSDEEISTTEVIEISPEIVTVSNSSTQNNPLISSLTEGFPHLQHIIPDEKIQPHSESSEEEIVTMDEYKIPLRKQNRNTEASALKFREENVLQFPSGSIREQKEFNISSDRVTPMKSENNLHSQLKKDGDLRNSNLDEETFETIDLPVKVNLKYHSNISELENAPDHHKIPKEVSADFHENRDLPSKQIDDKIDEDKDTDFVDSPNKTEKLFTSSKASKTKLQETRNDVEDVKNEEEIVVQSFSDEEEETQFNEEAIIISSEKQSEHATDFRKEREREILGEKSSGSASSANAATKYYEDDYEMTNHHIQTISFKDTCHQMTNDVRVTEPATNHSPQESTIVEEITTEVLKIPYKTPGKSDRTVIEKSPSSYNDDDEMTSHVHTIHFKDTAHQLIDDDQVIKESLREDSTGEEEITTTELLQIPPKHPENKSEKTVTEKRARSENDNVGDEEIASHHVQTINFRDTSHQLIDDHPITKESPREDSTSEEETTTTQLLQIPSKALAKLDKAVIEKSSRSENDNDGDDEEMTRHHVQTISFRDTAHQITKDETLTKLEARQSQREDSTSQSKYPEDKSKRAVIKKSSRSDNDNDGDDDEMISYHVQTISFSDTAHQIPDDVRVTNPTFKQSKREDSTSEEKTTTSEVLQMPSKSPAKSDRAVIKKSTRSDNDADVDDEEMTSHHVQTISFRDTAYQITEDETLTKLEAKQLQREDSTIEEETTTSEVLQIPSKSPTKSDRAVIEKSPRSDNDNDGDDEELISHHVQTISFRDTAHQIPDDVRITNPTFKQLPREGSSSEEETTTTDVLKIPFKSRTKSDRAVIEKSTRSDNDADGDDEEMTSDVQTIHFKDTAHQLIDDDQVTKESPREGSTSEEEIITTELLQIPAMTPAKSDRAFIEKNPRSSKDNDGDEEMTSLVDTIHFKDIAHQLIDDDQVTIKSPREGTTGKEETATTQVLQILSTSSAKSEKAVIEKSSRSDNDGDGADEELTTHHVQTISYRDTIHQITDDEEFNKPSPRVGSTGEEEITTGVLQIPFSKGAKSDKSVPGKNARIHASANKKGLQKNAPDFEKMSTSNMPPVSRPEHIIDRSDISKREIIGEMQGALSSGFDGELGEGDRLHSSFDEEVFVTETIHLPNTSAKSYQNQPAVRNVEEKYLNTNTSNRTMPVQFDHSNPSGNKSELQDKIISDNQAGEIGRQAVNISLQDEIPGDGQREEIFSSAIAVAKQDLSQWLHQSIEQNERDRIAQQFVGKVSPIESEQYSEQTVDINQNIEPYSLALPSLTRHKDALATHHGEVEQSQGTENQQGSLHKAERNILQSENAENPFIQSQNANQFLQNPEGHKEVSENTDFFATESEVDEKLIIPKKTARRMQTFEEVVETLQETDKSGNGELLTEHPPSVYHRPGIDNAEEPKLLEQRMEQLVNETPLSRWKRPKSVERRESFKLPTDVKKEKWETAEELRASSGERLEKSTQRVPTHYVTNTISASNPGLSRVQQSQLPRHDPSHSFDSTSVKSLPIDNAEEVDERLIIPKKKRQQLQAFRETVEFPMPLDSSGELHWTDRQEEQWQSHDRQTMDLNSAQRHIGQPQMAKQQTRDLSVIEIQARNFHGMERTIEEMQHPSSSEEFVITKNRLTTEGQREQQKTTKDSEALEEIYEEMITPNIRKRDQHPFKEIVEILLSSNISGESQTDEKQIEKSHICDKGQEQMQDSIRPSEESQNASSSDDEFFATEKFMHPISTNEQLETFNKLSCASEERLVPKSDRKHQRYYMTETDSESNPESSLTERPLLQQHDSAVAPNVSDINSPTNDNPKEIDEKLIIPKKRSQQLQTFREVVEVLPASDLEGNPENQSHHRPDLTHSTASDNSNKYKPFQRIEQSEAVQSREMISSKWETPKTETSSSKRKDKHIMSSDLTGSQNLMAAREIARSNSQPKFLRADQLSEEHYEQSRQYQQFASQEDQRGELLPSNSQDNSNPHSLAYTSHDSSIQQLASDKVLFKPNVEERVSRSEREQPISYKGNQVDVPDSAFNNTQSYKYPTDSTVLQQHYDYASDLPRSQTEIITYTLVGDKTTPSNPHQSTTAIPNIQPGQLQDSNEQESYAESNLNPIHEVLQIGRNYTEREEQFVFEESHQSASALLNTGYGCSRVNYGENKYHETINNFNPREPRNENLPIERNFIERGENFMLEDVRPSLQQSHTSLPVSSPYSEFRNSGPDVYYLSNPQNIGDQSLVASQASSSLLHKKAGNTRNENDTTGTKQYTSTKTWAESSQTPETMMQARDCTSTSAKGLPLSQSQQRVNPGHNNPDPHKSNKKQTQVSVEVLPPAMAQQTTSLNQDVIAVSRSETSPEDHLGDYVMSVGDPRMYPDHLTCIEYHNQPLKAQAKTSPESIASATGRTSAKVYSWTNEKQTSLKECLEEDDNKQTAAQGQSFQGQEKDMVSEVEQYQVREMTSRTETKQSTTEMEQLNDPKTIEELHSGLLTIQIPPESEEESLILSTETELYIPLERNIFTHTMDTPKPFEDTVMEGQTTQPMETRQQQSILGNINEAEEVIKIGWKIEQTKQESGILQSEAKFDNTVSHTFSILPSRTIENETNLMNDSSNPYHETTSLQQRSPFTYGSYVEKPNERVSQQHLEESVPSSQTTNKENSEQSYTLKSSKMEFATVETSRHEGGERQSDEVDITIMQQNVGRRSPSQYSSSSSEEEVIIVEEFIIEPDKESLTLQNRSVTANKRRRRRKKGVETRTESDDGEDIGSTDDLSSEGCATPSSILEEQEEEEEEGPGGEDEAVEDLKTEEKVKGAQRTLQAFPRPTPQVSYHEPEVTKSARRNQRFTLPSDEHAGNQHLHPDMKLHGLEHLIYDSGVYSDRSSGTDHRKSQEDQDHDRTLSAEDQSVEIIHLPGLVENVFLEEDGAQTLDGEDSHDHLSSTYNDSDITLTNNPIMEPEIAPDVVTPRSNFRDRIRAYFRHSSIDNGQNTGSNGQNSNSNISHGDASSSTQNTSFVTGTSARNRNENVIGNSNIEETENESVDSPMQGTLNVVAITATTPQSGNTFFNNLISGQDRLLRASIRDRPFSGEFSDVSTSYYIPGWHSQQCANESQVSASLNDAPLRQNVPQSDSLVYPLPLSNQKSLIKSEKSNNAGTSSDQKPVSIQNSSENQFHPRGREIDTEERRRLEILALAAEVINASQQTRESDRHLEVADSLVREWDGGFNGNDETIENITFTDASTATSTTNEDFPGVIIPKIRAALVSREPSNATQNSLRNKHDENGRSRSKDPKNSGDGAFISSSMTIKSGPVLQRRQRPTMVSSYTQTNNVPTSQSNSMISASRTSSLTQTLPKKSTDTHSQTSRISSTDALAQTPQIDATDTQSQTSQISSTDTHSQTSYISSAEIHLQTSQIPSTDTHTQTSQISLANAPSQTPHIYSANVHIQTPHISSRETHSQTSQISSSANAPPQTSKISAGDAQSQTTEIFSMDQPSQTSYISSADIQLQNWHISSTETHSETSQISSSDAPYQPSQIFLDTQSQTYQISSSDTHSQVSSQTASSYSQTPALSSEPHRLLLTSTLTQTPPENPPTSEKSSSTVSSYSQMEIDEDQTSLRKFTKGSEDTTSAEVTTSTESVLPFSFITSETVQESYSQPLHTIEQRFSHDSTTESKNIKQRINHESFTDRERSRSPLPGRRGILSASSSLNMDISNQDILNEIEKLKSEHTKMMDLLKRSRENKSKGRTPLKSPMQTRTRSKSPKSTVDSDSSGGDSPVTVIARSGSNRGSVTESPVALSMTDNGVPPEILDNVIDDDNNNGQTQIRLISVKHETFVPEHDDVDADIVESDSAVPVNAQVEEIKREGLSSHESYSDSSFESNLEELFLRVPESLIATSHPPNTTLFEHAEGAFKPTPKLYKASEAQPPAYDERTMELIKESSNTLASASRESSGERSQGLDMDSLSTISRTSNVSPLTLQAVMDDDADSAFSGSTVMNTRQMVSTGTEANVSSSDDFTQTDSFDGAHHLTLDESLLLTLRSSGSSHGDSSDMSRIQRELERLNRERIEIIELLSLQYLPSSLTIELLEAKLNYCIGQTDLLLASLEDAWEKEESQPKRSEKLMKVTRRYIDEYRSVFARSKEDIESCLETHQRKRDGIRGRRRTRGRDTMRMRRRAEIEAFKLERLREQCKYERLKDKGRVFSPLPSENYKSSTNLPLHSDAYVQSMTPSERNRYLINLRRQLVHSSASEMAQLHRSMNSPRSASPGSNTDSTYWAYRPSSYSPARSESPSTFSMTTSRREQFSSNTNTNRTPRHLNDEGYMSVSISAPQRPHSSEPILESLSTDHRTNVVVSYSTSDLNADRLLQESNAMRRQNQAQIEEAREVLRQLDERRRQYELTNRSKCKKDSKTKSKPEESKGSSSNPHRSVPSSHVDYRIRAIARNFIPSQTSSPRVASTSYAEHARDHLTRTQRRMDSMAHKYNLASNSQSHSSPVSQMSPLALRPQPSSLSSRTMVYNYNIQTHQHDAYDRKHPSERSASSSQSSSFDRYAKYLKEMPSNSSKSSKSNASSTESSTERLDHGYAMPNSHREANASSLSPNRPIRAVSSSPLRPSRLYHNRPLSSDYHYDNPSCHYSPSRISDQRQTFFPRHNAGGDHYYAYGERTVGRPQQSASLVSSSNQNEILSQNQSDMHVTTTMTRISYSSPRAQDDQLANPRNPGRSSLNASVSFCGSDDTSHSSLQSTDLDCYFRSSQGEDGRDEFIWFNSRPINSSDITGKILEQRKKK